MFFAARVVDSVPRATRASQVAPMRLLQARTGPIHLLPAEERIATRAYLRALVQHEPRFGGSAAYAVVCGTLQDVLRGVGAVPLHARVAVNERYLPEWDDDGLTRYVWKHGETSAIEQRVRNIPRLTRYESPLRPFVYPCHPRLRKCYQHVLHVLCADVGARIAKDHLDYFVGTEQQMVDFFSQCQARMDAARFPRVEVGRLARLRHQYAATERM